MNVRAARWALSALVVGIGLAAAIPALAKSDNKPHTWTVVLRDGKIQNAACNPSEPDEPFPVFKKGRGDRIQFVSRDNRYWVRFRSPTPLRLKGEPVQMFQVYAFGDRPTPVYTFTTDAPPEGSDWERFPFEIHDAQDMPKDAADQERDLHTGGRPKPPSLKERQKQKLSIELLIDGVK